MTAVGMKKILVHIFLKIYVRLIFFLQSQTQSLSSLNFYRFLQKFE